MIEYAKLFQPDNIKTMTLFEKLPGDLQIFLCTGYTDLRKSIDGLSAVVENNYGLNPYAKAFYCFCGKRADRLKILFFDGNSYFLLLQRMEEVRFKWPRATEEMWKISFLSFLKLLRGERIEKKDALKVFEKLSDHLL